MVAVNDILAQVLALPLKQRARLARELIVSLDEGPPEDPEDVAKAWDEEIARRGDDVRSGRVKTVPWSTVKRGMNRAVERARRHRSRAR